MRQILALLFAFLAPSVADACTGTSVDGSTPITVATGITYCITGDNLAVGDFDLFTGSAANVTIDFQGFKLGHATTSTSREIIHLSGTGLTILGDGSGAGTLGSANVISGGTATITGVRFENDDAVAAVPLDITGGAIVTMDRSEMSVTSTALGYAFRVTLGTLTASDCIFRQNGNQDVCRIDAGANVDITGSTFVGSGNTASELFYSRQATTESCVLSGNIFKNFAAARCWNFIVTAFYEGTSGGTLTVNNNCLIRSDANADIVNPGTDDLANIPGTGNVSVDPTFATDTVLGAGTLTAGSPMEDANLTAYAGTLDFYGTTRKAVTPTIGAFDFGAGASPTGACCTGAVCTIDTSAGCTGGGGTYQGDSTTCSPDPCTGATAACCTDPGGLNVGPGTLSAGTCTITTEGACAGDWFSAETTCTPNPCPGDGASLNGYLLSKTYKLIGNQAMLDRVFLEYSTATKTTKDDIFAAVVNQSVSYMGAADASNATASFKVFTLISASIILGPTNGADERAKGLAAMEYALDNGWAGASGSTYPIWALCVNFYQDDLDATQKATFFDEWLTDCGISQTEAEGGGGEPEYLWGSDPKAPFYTLVGEAWELGSTAAVVRTWKVADAWKAVAAQGMLNNIMDETRGWDEHAIGGVSSMQGGAYPAVEDYLASDGVGPKGEKHYEQKRVQYIAWLCWMLDAYGISDEWLQLPGYIEGKAQSVAIHMKPDGLMSQLGTGLTITKNDRTWAAMAMINAQYPATDGGKRALWILEQGPALAWASSNEKYNFALAALLWVEDNTSLAPEAQDFYTSGDPDGNLTVGDGVPLGSQIIVRDPGFDYGVGGLYSKAVLGQVWPSDYWAPGNGFELYFNGPQILRGDLYGKLTSDPLSHYPGSYSMAISHSDLWVADPTETGQVPLRAVDFAKRWAPQFSGYSTDLTSDFPGQPPKAEVITDIDPNEVGGSRYIPTRWTQTARVTVDSQPIAFERSTSDPEMLWYGLNAERDVSRWEIDYVYLGGGTGHEVIRRHIAEITSGQGTRDFVSNYALMNDPTMAGTLLETVEAGHLIRYNYADGLVFTSINTQTVEQPGITGSITYDSRMETYSFVDTDATLTVAAKVGGFDGANPGWEAWHFMDIDDIGTGVNLIIPASSSMHDFPLAYDGVYQISKWKAQLHFANATYVHKLDYHELGTAAGGALPENPVEVTGTGLQGVYLGQHNWSVVLPNETDWSTLTYVTPAGTAMDHIIAWADGASSYDVTVNGEPASSVVPNGTNVLTFVADGGTIVVTASGSPTGACCYRNGACAITLSAGCSAFYRGDGSVCDPNPCHSLSRRATVLKWRTISR